MPTKSEYLNKVLLAVGVLIIMSVSGASCAGRDSTEAKGVRSPDGRVEVVFSLRSGAPHYRVDYDGKPVILPSSMGFTFRKAEPLLDGFKVDRRPVPSTRPGGPSGDSAKRYGTTTTNCA